MSSNPNTIPDGARATGDSVRGVLGVSDDDLTTHDLAPAIRGAHNLVERRLARHTTDEAALADVETRVAADLAIGLLQGAQAGIDAQNIEEISEMDLTIRYDTSVTESVGVGNSRHWDVACLLDPTGLLGHAEGGWPYSTG